ncbi:MAG: DUF2184 domain-containing protein [Desulfovibrionaceae bacterium]|nr:DUF2184 domain-containing protein [Desulfovibrionaceae bacterium]
MAFKTYDQRTIDSTGAFFVGELERFDKTLHEPLSSQTWGRDIDLRTDVSIGDETTSFSRTDFAAAGSPNPNGKNFLSDTATDIPGIEVDVNKIPSPLYLWGMQLGFSIIELEKAQQVGRPLEQQKMAGLKLKYNMDIDEMVYVGDTAVGKTGLINNPAIPVMNVSGAWGNNPEVILETVNDILNAAWKSSGYTLCPTHLLLPPRQYTLLNQPVTSAGSRSILDYVSKDCMANGINGKPLDINPLKWLDKRGTGQTGRAVAYTKGEQYVRFPLVPINHTPVQYRGLHHITTYYAKLGVVEFVYPETVAYADGL